MHLHRFKVVSRHLGNPANRRFALCPFLQKREHRFCRRHFIPAAEHIVHSRNSCHLLRLSLGIAAGNHNSRSRILPHRAPDHLPAFAVTLRRHRAGVDHIGIVDCMKRRDLHAVRLQIFRNRLTFILTDLAAERADSHTRFFLLCACFFCHSFPSATFTVTIYPCILSPSIR